MNVVRAGAVTFGDMTDRIVGPLFAAVYRALPKKERFEAHRAGDKLARIICGLVRWYVGFLISQGPIGNMLIAIHDLCTATTAHGSQARTRAACSALLHILSVVGTFFIDPYFFLIGPFTEVFVGPAQAFGVWERQPRPRRARTT